MAYTNTNNPFGLSTNFASLTGAVNYANRTIKGGIASGNSTKIYPGDPVKLLSTGYVAQWTAGTAVSQLAGIFAGCEYTSSSQGKRVFSNYWPGADAAADADVFLVPCEAATPATFVIQTDATGLALASRGYNFDVVVGTGTVTGGFGRSGCYLDVSTQATTATLPFRFLNLYVDGAVPNTPGTGAGAYNWVVVAANVFGQTGI